MDTLARVLELARKIDRLQPEVQKLETELGTVRAQLAEAEAEVRSLLRPDAEVLVERKFPAGHQVDCAQVTTNLTDRILAELNRWSDRRFSPAVLAMAIDENGRIESVRSTLYRLWQEKRVERPAEGEYQAKTAKDNGYPLFSQADSSAENLPQKEK
jgi:hypothetical protein